jgi:hypothetical protein
MTYNFAFENRILLCAHCGAPLEASSDGGTVVCKYCKTANRLTARSSLPTFAPSIAGELSATQRLANLRWICILRRECTWPSTPRPRSWGLGGDLARGDATVFEGRCSSS